MSLYPRPPSAVTALNGFSDAASSPPVALPPPRGRGKHQARNSWLSYVAGFCNGAAVAASCSRSSLHGHRPAAAAGTTATRSSARFTGSGTLPEPAPHLSGRRPKAFCSWGQVNLHHPLFGVDTKGNWLLYERFAFDFLQSWCRSTL